MAGIKNITKKHMIIIIWSVFLVLLVLSVSFLFFRIAELNTDIEYYNRSVKYDKIQKDVYYVSLIELVATPERYDGKKVNVTGCGYIHEYGGALYVFEDACYDDIRENGIELGFSSKQQSKKRGSLITIEGVFKQSNSDKANDFMGRIICE